MNALLIGIALTIVAAVGQTLALAHVLSLGLANPSERLTGVFWLAALGLAGSVAVALFALHRRRRAPSIYVLCLAAAITGAWVADGFVYVRAYRPLGHVEANGSERQRQQLIARLDAMRVATPDTSLIRTPNMRLKGREDLRAMIDGATRDLLPLAGISLRPSLHCLECGRFAGYASDEHGFNNRRQLWDKAPVHMVAVGDSFTHGYCVAPEEGLMEPLRQRWERSLNLGFSGNGPLLMLATLVEYGPILRPKVVLFNYWSGDLPRLAIEAADPLLRRYLEPGFRQGLVEHQDAVDAALASSEAAWLTDQRTRSFVPPSLARFRILDVLLLRHLADRRHIRLLVSEDEYRRSIPALAPIMGRVLHLASETVRQWGGTLVVTYLPEVAETNGLPLPAKAAVLALAGAEGLAVIDVARAFEGAPLQMRPGCPHYDAAGYAAAGRFLEGEVARMFPNLEHE